MGRFRKRPVVISAERWFPASTIEGVREIDTGDAMTEVIGQIDTLEGVMTVMPGDWVLTGVKGERYPCRDDIFQLTYEPVDE